MTTGSNLQLSSGHRPNVPGTKRSHSWRCQYTVLAVTGLLLTFEAHTQTIAVALDQAWSRHPQAVTFVARLDEAKARGDLAGSFTPNPPAISLSNATDRLNADAAR